VQPAADPSNAAVAFITTEHFTLQGARAATIADSIGRATMFVGSLSGGLVALGLVAAAAHIGTVFYAFGLIVLPTFAFIGLVTFQRALQSGVEDLGYGRRIARLRAYYSDNAPEITSYLASVPGLERLTIEGLPSGHWQIFRTVAGMVAVITAVVAGSSAGLVADVSSGYSLAAALGSGAAFGAAVLVALMRYQAAVWRRASNAPLFL
jgi:hypothetical protein